MKRLLLILTTLALNLTLATSLLGADTQSVNDALKRLKETINESEKYDKEKESQIRTLRTRLSRAHDAREKYQVARDLVKQYSTYECDSALHYVNMSISLAREIGIETSETRAILAKCDILGRAGLFSEAINLLDTLNPESMPEDLRQKYYSVKYSLSQYMFENTIGTEFESIYDAQRRQYCDSAYKLAGANAFDRGVMMATRLIESGENKKAVALLDSAAKSYREGEREYSMIRSIQAVPQQALNPNGDEAIVSLCEAAISDIKGSIKENMAIRQLAKLLNERGEVESANLFVKKGMEDASFFSARMRSNQIGRMLPLIDRQYDAMQHEIKKRLRITIYILVGVAIIFAIGMFFIIRLTRRLRRANENLQQSNQQVRALNDEIREASEVTKDLNLKLREANKIKEAYLGQFMEMSSRSINSLEHFRKALLLQLTMGKTDEMRKMLKSNVNVSDALKELYVTFDKAFLTIFPKFPDQFNSLLNEEARFDIRPDEPFSTEMRIYALLRMGITDNHRIAEFLRCSLSTIYTYRSRMKSRAIDPDRFEEEIMQIMAIEPLGKDAAKDSGKEKGKPK